MYHLHLLLNQKVTATTTTIIAQVQQVAPFLFTF